MELPAAKVYPGGIPEALAAGGLTAEVVDRAALRVLRLKLRLGLMERPYVEEGPIVLERDEDRALSREVADASLTLLQNDGVLPLDAERCGRVAVSEVIELKVEYGRYRSLDLDSNQQDKE